MKTFGIRISILFYTLLISLQLDAQLSCPCQSSKCGDIIASFKLGGNVTEVCDGHEFEVLNNTTSEGVNYYIWDWADGTQDSVISNSPVKHLFKIPDNKVCSQNYTLFEICLLAVKKCNINDYSCHSNRSPVKVYHRPVARFDYEKTICVNKEVQFTDNSCNVESTQGQSYLWTFHDGTTSTLENPKKTYNTPGTYNVKLTVFNRCGYDDTIQQIRILGYPDAVFNISSEAIDGKVCENQTITLIDTSNIWAVNNKWTFPLDKDPLKEKTSWKVSDELIRKDTMSFGIKDSIRYADTLVIEMIEVGKYTFRLTSMNICTTIYKDFIVEVVPKPNIGEITGTTLCESGNYNPAPPSISNGDVLHHKWIFENGNPSMDTLKDPGNIFYNLPGSHKVTYQATAECGNIEKTTTVTVNGKRKLNISDFQSLYCLSSSPDTLKVDTTGGDWSGPGINPTTGVFDPEVAGPGTFNIVYSIGPPGCLSADTIQIKVVESEVINIPMPVICENAPPTQLSSVSGGTWSGHPAVNSNGFFNPLESGPGNFPIQFEKTDANGCLIQNAITVEVVPLPIITAIDTAVACAGNDLLQLADVFGLTSENGITDSFVYDNKYLPQPVKLSDFPIGKYKIQLYRKNKACMVSDSMTLSVVPDALITLSKDTSVCNSGTLTLTSNSTKGIWEGTGIDPNTGIINLSLTMSGANVYTYVYEKGTTCEQLPKVTVNVTDPAENLSIQGPENLCVGSSNTLMLMANESGGIWKGNGIDSITGIIDLGALQLNAVNTYEYCREVPGLKECRACVTHQFTLYSLPNADFQIDGTACINEEITFKNTSTDAFNIKSVLWKFDNGQTSTSFNPPVQKYSEKKDYAISLKITNEKGCSSEVSSNLHITEKPISDFELLSPEEACAPYKLMVNNLSSGENVNYLWELNQTEINDNEINGYIIDSILSTLNVYLTLKAKNECGEVVKKDSFTVKPYPHVVLGVSDEQGCSPLVIDFANSTQGNADMWIWNMGNGQVYADSLPPNQTYTTTKDSISIFSVSLIASNECGTDTAMQTVTVYPPDVTAFIQAPGITPCQYDSLQMLAVSSPGSTNTWKIVLPDGSITGASGDRPWINFPMAGSYKIILFASRCGSDSDTTTVNVSPAPLADFVLPDYLCLNDTIKLIPLGGQLASVEWNFGDGYKTNEFWATHRYAAPGNYNIELITTSQITGCKNKIEKSLTVVGIPNASFLQDKTNGCEPLKIQFNSTSQNVLNHNWEFGDGTSNSQLSDPSHLFEKSGNFKVKLTVWDTYGCFQDTSLINVIVYPKPIASFAFSKSSYCTIHDSLSIVNTSLGASSYIWKFKGITDTSSIIPTIPLTEQGVWEVTQIAISERGCMDTVSNAVNVLSSPDAEFTASNVSGCQNLTVDFTNLSPHGDLYLWNFDNGDVSANFSPNVTYDKPGIYYPQLIASSLNGCPSDTAKIKIEVFPKPVADFTYAKDSICGVPMGVTLTNTSVGQDQNEWIVDGIATGQSTHLKVNLKEDKVYKLALITTTIYGCKDTANADIPIYQNPIANFKVADIACEEEIIVLSNLSTGSKQYSWIIDGKGSTSAAEPSLSFDKAGVYNIQLIAIYNEQCTDTFVYPLPITIFEKPKADFTWITGFDDGIKGEVKFTNQSEDFDALFWNFGDNYNSTDENPIHEYDINRPINATLIAYNENSGLWTCLDSITKKIEPEWIKSFYAPNALSPDYGEGLTGVFKPVGIGMKTYQISVYSPWGEQVWSSTALDDKGSPVEFWDGTYRNETVPQGAYSWRADIRWADGTETVKVGSVVVLR